VCKPRGPGSIGELKNVQNLEEFMGRAVGMGGKQAFSLSSYSEVHGFLC
jgi:hypothetical protein